jgi:transcriptional regulator with XRE-family HTH domain
MFDPESVTHKEALSVFRSAFIRRVGIGKVKMSYGDLSDATGIQVRTLKSWSEGASMPHLDSLLKLCAVFGPDFTSEILSIVGQGGVENLEADNSVDALGTAADLIKVTNNIMERLQDGVFCHRDKASVGPLLLGLAHKIEEQGKAMLAAVPK